MLAILREHPKIIFFCFIVFSFGCLGQTYLLAWFNPSILEELNLTRTELSLIYASATFLSSMFLPHIGKQLDRVRTLYFALFVATMVGLGYLLLGKMGSIYSLFIAYFVIRTFGQMSLSLIASTTITRKFGMHRGKILSLAQLGRTLGEAIWPGIIVYLISTSGWRNSTWQIAGIFIVIFVPLCFVFLRNFSFTPLFEENKNLKTIENTGEFKRKKFYSFKPIILVLIANSLIPFVLTGLFFQQTAIAQMKGWSETLMSSAFTAYAGIQVFSLIIAGFLVDKFSATRILPLPLIPFALGLLCLNFFDGKWSCYLYLALVGFGTGISANIRSSFYAENFALNILGEIKSIDSSYLVKATAIAPIVFAYMLDKGFQIQQLVVSMTILTIICLGFYSYASVAFMRRHA